MNWNILRIGRGIMMKNLRITFFLLFVGLCILVSFGVGATVYLRYVQYITTSYKDTMRRVAVSIVKTNPMLQDTGALIGEGEARSEIYFGLLRNIGTINDEFGFAYIYYTDKTEEGFHFIFDTDDLALETPGEFDEIWLELYEDVPGELNEAWESGEVQFTARPYTDEWGTFISLFYPVHSEENKVVGVIGIDYDVTTVQDMERQARRDLLIAFVIAIFIASLLSLKVSTSLSAPINQVARAAAGLTDMHLEFTFPRGRRDEIGKLQDALYFIRSKLKKNIDDITNEHMGQKNISENLKNATNDSSAGLEIITGSMNSVQEKADVQMKSVINTLGSVKSIVSH
ncbi:MAG: hypothetical protein LBF78_02415, partial [Treponema sp.]|nr:hypothetical protein [Treponema sp.]